MIAFLGGMALAYSFGAVLGFFVWRRQRNLYRARWRRAVGVLDFFAQQLEECQTLLENAAAAQELRAAQRRSEELLRENAKFRELVERDWDVAAKKNAERKTVPDLSNVEAAIRDVNANPAFWYAAKKHGIKWP